MKIDNRLEDVAVLTCAATDAEAWLNRILAKVAVLKRKVTSRRDRGGEWSTPIPEAWSSSAANGG